MYLAEIYLLKKREGDEPPINAIFCFNILELLTLVPLRLALIFYGSTKAFSQSYKECDTEGGGIGAIRKFMIFLICLGYILALFYLIFFVVAINSLCRYCSIEGKKSTRRKYEY